MGSYTINAEFGGDANFAPSYGTASLVVAPTTPPPPTPVQTTTAVTPKYQQITVGSEASFTITVSPAVSGTDTVTLYDLGPANTTTVGGKTKTLLGTAAYDSTNLDWTFTTAAPLPVGLHTIDASFGGDANFTPSDGYASVTVVPIQTTTVVTPKSQQITAGSQAVFTIAVSPAVPGADTVTLYAIPQANTAGGVTTRTLLGTATYNSANSDWTFSTTALPVGTDEIDAVFSGDPNFTPSYGLATVTVLPASNTVS